MAGGGETQRRDYNGGGDLRASITSPPLLAGVQAACRDLAYAASLSYVNAVKYIHPAVKGREVWIAQKMAWHKRIRGERERERKRKNNERKRERGQRELGHFCSILLRSYVGHSDTPEEGICKSDIIMPLAPGDAPAMFPALVSYLFIYLFFIWFRIPVVPMHLVSRHYRELRVMNGSLEVHTNEENH